MWTWAGGRQKRWNTRLGPIHRSTYSSLLLTRWRTPSRSHPTLESSINPITSKNVQGPHVCLWAHYLSTLLHWGLRVSMRLGGAKPKQWHCLFIYYAWTVRRLPLPWENGAWGTVYISHRSVLIIPPKPHRPWPLQIFCSHGAHGNHPSAVQCPQWLGLSQFTCPCLCFPLSQVAIVYFSWIFDIDLSIIFIKTNSVYISQPPRCLYLEKSRAAWKWVPCRPGQQTLGPEGCSLIPLLIRIAHSCLL